MRRSRNTRASAYLSIGPGRRSISGALSQLGESENGTVHLEEAVAAFRDALKEATRERVPLDRATAQNSLGSALRIIGERTVWLEEAVAAFREALKERTRERTPLDWAATQADLGTALWMIGERANGSARLEEAALAYREALKEYPCARTVPMGDDANRSG
jgi:tetratricopeptide (TPR) repeat protein